MLLRVKWNVLTCHFTSSYSGVETFGINIDIVLFSIYPLEPSGKIESVKRFPTEFVLLM